MVRVAFVGLTVAVVVLACGTEETAFTAGSGASSSSSNSSNSNSGGDGGTSSSESSANGGTQATGGGSTQSSAMGGSSMGGNGPSGPGPAGPGSGGGPSDCPPEPGDTPCTTCIKTSCCQQGLDCFQDEECTTCVECLETAGDPGQCFDSSGQGSVECDFNDPETGAFLSCAGQNCEGPCQG